MKPFHSLRNNCAFLLTILSCEQPAGAQNMSVNFVCGDWRPKTILDIHSIEK